LGVAFRLSLNAGGVVSARIADDTVEVWRFDLDDDRGESAATFLTAREMQRAHRIISPIARRRFVAGRARVREVLSRYCDLHPSRVPLGQSRYGKPYLKAPYSRISFNFSRSRGLAVVAVCAGGSIGVDLERRRDIASEAIAATWLHDAERRDLLRSAGSKDDHQAFFRLWCRKEAVVKAEGSGLHFPLHEFRVSTSEKRAEVLSWPTESCQWHLRDLTIDERYAGAIALDRPVGTVRYRELQ
jgi:4'-phosphopantetheinyl transferase